MAEIMNQDNLIEAKDLSLEEWLSLVYVPPKDKIFVKNRFPSDKHRDEYIASVEGREDKEIINLLHNFLFTSTSFEFFDQINIESLKHKQKSNPELFKKMLSHTYYQRLIKYFTVSKDIYPWEGITWTLDLLPHSPKIALEGLNAYIFAHIPILPDAVLQGLWDAEEVIRARYIGLPKTQDDKVAALLELHFRDFEHLTERLYNSMEYKTWLTQPSRDGGRDIVAKINIGAKKEFLLIECKRYTDPVDVSIVRELYGVVNSEKANRGVLVTSSRFTPEAQKFADENSIQLIDGYDFVLLLNEHLGADWFQKLDRILAESKKHYQETKGQEKAK